MGASITFMEIRLEAESEQVKVKALIEGPAVAP